MWICSVKRRVCARVRIACDPQLIFLSDRQTGCHYLCVCACSGVCLRDMTCACTCTVHGGVVSIVPVYRMPWRRTNRSMKLPYTEKGKQDKRRRCQKDEEGDWRKHKSEFSNAYHVYCPADSIQAMHLRNNTRGYHEQRAANTSKKEAHTHETRETACKRQKLTRREYSELAFVHKQTSTPRHPHPRGKQRCNGKDRTR